MRRDGAVEPLGQHAKKFSKCPLVWRKFAWKAENMSSIRTWAVTFIIAFCMQAQASERLELSEIIASCTGRLSAEMEFAWLMSDPEADQLQHRRSHFIEILESLGPGADPRRQMALRIETKMAHGRLLTTAYFSPDAIRAAWAKRQAIRQRSTCENLLLDS